MATQRPDVLGRDGSGPVRVRTEVLSTDTHGPYHTMSIAAPAIAERARPGQFVEIAVRGPHTVLRRPFSIARAGNRGAPGIIDVVYDPHGPGTEWLAELPARSRIDVVGPLGTHFQLPEDGSACVVVGGGYGVAPLYLLSDDLRAADCAVHFVAGAATQGRLFNVIEAKRTSATATFTTEDGSFGTRGRVTDVLVDVIRRNGAEHVYACGPMGMLRAVAAVCADVGVSSQLAVEEHMACGVGVCWTCVIPTRRRGETEVRNRRTCIDGPVLDGAEIAWDETRWRDAVPTWLAGDVADAAASPPDPRGAAPPPPAPPRPAPFSAVPRPPLAGSPATSGSLPASPTAPPTPTPTPTPSSRGTRTDEVAAPGRAAPATRGTRPASPAASLSPELRAQRERREAALAEQRAESERRRAEREAERRRARAEREAWLRASRGERGGGRTVVLPQAAPEPSSRPSPDAEPPLFVEGQASEAEGVDR